MQSSKELMVTDHYELTTKYMPIKDLDMKSKYLYDDRLEIVMSVVNRYEYDKIRFAYLQSFCELVNRDPNCYPARYTNCGFVPVGIEPVPHYGILNTDVIRKLREKGLQFFSVQPSSPVSSNFKYRNLKTTSDIWVSKLDAGEFLGVMPHEVTAMDLLKAVLK